MDPVDPDPQHWSPPSPKPAGTVAGSNSCTLVLWEQGAQEGEEEEGMRGRLVLLGRAPANRKHTKASSHAHIPHTAGSMVWDVFCLLKTRARIP